MSDTVRVVVAGCGGIAGAWIPHAKQWDDVTIVGLMDLREEAALQRKAAFELPDDVRTGNDLETLLRDLKPDVVWNLTTPEAHRQVTLTAFDHGCHVMTEKPLADSMEAAREMVAAAESAGKILAVIQNRRYANTIRTLREFIESSMLGRVTTLNCDFYIGAHFGGFRDRMQHVLLLDMAIHTFDAARLIGGADPVSVYCHEWNPAGSWYDHDASAIAIFEMTGGLIYTYRGSWCAEGCNSTWECDWRVVGERGSVLWDGAEMFKAQAVVSPTGFMTPKADIQLNVRDFGPKNGGHAANIREFIDCVRHGGTPETVAADNIKSLAMVFAAIESAETGKKVKVSL